MTRVMIKQGRKKWKNRERERQMEGEHGRGVVTDPV